MSEEKKFCVNCRHHYHNNGAALSIPSGHRCTHSKLTGWDWVTGDRTYPLCRDMRQMDLWCGTQAKEFEPKVTVLHPIHKEKIDD